MPIRRAALASTRHAFTQATETEQRIGERIEAKRAEIAKLQAARDELALDVILEEAGAKDAYDERNAAVEKAQGEFKLLETAHAEAERRAERAAFERRRAEREEVRRNIQRLRKQQIQAAEDCQKAIETAWRSMLRAQELGEKIAVAFPGGAPAMAGFFLYPKEIHEEIGFELWRVSYPADPARPDLDRFFPKPEYPGALLTGQLGQDGVPESAMIGTLVQRAKDGAAFMDRVLMEQRTLSGHEGPGAADYTPIEFEPEAKDEEQVS